MHTYIHIHTCTHTYTYIHTYVRIHTYTHTYIMLVHTYVYTRTHIHTSCFYIHQHSHTCRAEAEAADRAWGRLVLFFFLAALRVCASRALRHAGGGVRGSLSSRILLRTCSELMGDALVAERLPGSNPRVATFSGPRFVSRTMCVCVCVCVCVQRLQGVPKPTDIET